MISSHQFGFLVNSVGANETVQNLKIKVNSPINAEMKPIKREFLAKFCAKMIGRSNVNHGTGYFKFYLKRI